MLKILALIATNIAWWMIPIKDDPVSLTFNGLMAFSVMMQFICLFRDD